VTHCGVTKVTNVTARPLYTTDIYNIKFINLSSLL